MFNSSTIRWMLAASIAAVAAVQATDAYATCTGCPVGKTRTDTFGSVSWSSALSFPSVCSSTGWVGTGDDSQGKGNYIEVDLDTTSWCMEAEGYQNSTPTAACAITCDYNANQCGYAWNSTTACNPDNTVRYHCVTCI